MTQSIDDQQLKMGWRKLVSIGSMSLLMVVVLLRAMSSHDPFPMWDSDPYLFSPPVTGITGGIGIMLNAAMTLLSLAIVVSLPTRNTKSESWMRLLLGVGYAGLCVHLVRDPGTLSSGSTLGAMMAACFAGRSFFAAYPEWTRVIGAVMLGGGVFLGIYGLDQVFIQHPQTVEAYGQNRDAFLQARGWVDGSFEVLTYERRLLQPEPTGWFGLSNVYASFIACFGIGLVMVTLCSLRRAWWILSGLLAVMLIAILLISKSKGGIGAGVLGFAIIQYALLRHRGRLSRVGTSTLCGCVLVMGGVLVGAMMHQLSLLFRGQYMVGSLRIFESNPLLGVGPGNFQNAYMVAKPSTSPEDVSSAHNLLFDLIAQMGLAGIAWVGVLVVMIWTARLPIVQQNDTDEQTQTNKIPRGVLIRMILGMVLVVGVGAIRLQSGAMDLELMLVLLFGVGCWIVTSLALGILVSDRAIRLAMIGGAIVLVIHGMLDLSPVWIVSAPLWGLCVGMGFGCGRDTSETSNPPPGVFGQIGGLAAIAGLGITGALAGIGSVNAISRDRQLIELASVAQEITQIQTILETPSQLEVAALRVSELAGISIPPQMGAIQEGLRQVELHDRISTAKRFIELADSTSDSKTTLVALEQSMMAAMAMDAEGIAGSELLWNWVRKTADVLAEEGGTFNELKWAGHAYKTLSAYQADTSGHLVANTIEIWTKADTLNPHDPKHAFRMMELALEVGDQQLATQWAAKAVERSAQMKLDPLKQLSPGMLKRAQDLSNQD